jgi:hypothetical protein
MYTKVQTICLVVTYVTTDDGWWLKKKNKKKNTILYYKYIHLHCYVVVLYFNIELT